MKLTARKTIALLIFGIFLLVTGVISIYVCDYIIQFKVHENVELVPNSTAWNFWLSPPATIYRQYWIFEVMNPDEIRMGEKPALAQRGPYTYREYWQKGNVSFDGNDNTVFYSPIRTLIFQPNMSAGLEDDKVTFINVPYLGMAQSLMHFPPAIIESASLMAEGLGEGLVTTRTVRELISGYEDPLLKIAARFVPAYKEYTIFGVETGHNATMYENYRILNGKENAQDHGKIVTWNGLKHLPFWNDDFANQINGSDGTSFPPFITKDSKLYAFSSDMCRSYYLTYQGDTSKYGIALYKFVLPNEVFADGRKYPDNEGFCVPCIGSGVLNISSCYHGVWSFISQPHFYNADLQFVDAVSGLRPNKEEHEFEIDFEPITGVALNVNVRLQVNFYMPQVRYMKELRYVKPIVFPFIWFNDSAVLDYDTALELKQVANIVQMLKITTTAFICTGAAIAFVALVIGTMKLVRHRNKQTVTIIPTLSETSPLMQDT